MSLPFLAGAGGTLDAAIVACLVCSDGLPCFGALYGPGWSVLAVVGSGWPLAVLV